MTTDLFLDFLGIMMDSRKAEGMAFTINLVTPDNGEQYIVELSNATLTNIEGYQAEDASIRAMRCALSGRRPIRSTP